MMRKTFDVLKAIFGPRGAMVAGVLRQIKDAKNKPALFIFCAWHGEPRAIAQVLSGKRGGQRNYPSALVRASPHTAKSLFAASGQ
jgi:hypothetical protein